MNIIDCDERDFLAPDEKEISDEELDTINMILYVKDRYNISGGGLITKWHSSWKRCHVTAD